MAMPCRTTLTLAPKHTGFSSHGFVRRFWRIPQPTCNDGEKSFHNLSGDRALQVSRKSPEERRPFSGLIRIEQGWENLKE